MFALPRPNGRYSVIALVYRGLLPPDTGRQGLECEGMRCQGRYWDHYVPLDPRSLFAANQVGEGKVSESLRVLELASICLQGWRRRSLLLD